MRKLVVWHLALALSFSLVSQAHAQTVSAEVGAQKEDFAAAAPANNPYITAQFGYMLTESGDFTDGILAAGAVATPAISLGPVLLPFLASLDLGEILTQLTKEELSLDEAREKIESVAATRRGFVAGAYPYYVQNLGSANLVIHGMAGYKGNVFGGQPGEAETDEADESQILHQLRLSGGLELQFPFPGDARLVTLGIAPAYHLFSEDSYNSIFGEPKSSLFVWEAHGVVPVPNLSNFAIMGEAIFGSDEVFGDESVTGFRAGVLILP